MNKTNKIEWTDYTWSPITGCWGPGGTAEKPNRCPAEDDPFAPRFFPERLNQPAEVKKPSKIFVCSMADLFGDWVPKPWILRVLERVNDVKNSHHLFQFLTKNPKRLKDFNPWPSNCWVGTIVTNQADADERIPWLLQVDAPVRFVSHEPLLGGINLYAESIKNGGAGPWKNDRCFGIKNCLPGIDWAIIGAMTGPGAVKPEPEWIFRLYGQYWAAGVPIFLKDNLNWPEKIQEWPR